MGSRGLALTLRRRSGSPLSPGSKRLLRPFARLRRRLVLFPFLCPVDPCSAVFSGGPALRSRSSALVLTGRPCRPSPWHSSEGTRRRTATGVQEGSNAKVRGRRSSAGGPIGPGPGSPPPVAGHPGRPARQAAIRDPRRFERAVAARRSGRDRWLRPCAPPVTISGRSPGPKPRLIVVGGSAPSSVAAHEPAHASTLALVTPESVDRLTMAPATEYRDVLGFAVVEGTPDLGGGQALGWAVRPPGGGAALLWRKSGGDARAVRRGSATERRAGGLLLETDDSPADHAVLAAARGVAVSMEFTRGPRGLRQRREFEDLYGNRLGEPDEAAVRRDCRSVVAGPGARRDDGPPTR